MLFALIGRPGCGRDGRHFLIDFLRSVGKALWTSKVLMIMYGLSLLLTVFECVVHED